MKIVFMSEVVFPAKLEKFSQYPHEPNLLFLKKYTNKLWKEASDFTCFFSNFQTDALTFRPHTF